MLAAVSPSTLDPSSVTSTTGTFGHGFNLAQRMCVLLMLQVIFSLIFSCRFYGKCLIRVYSQLSVCGNDCDIANKWIPLISMVLFI